MTDSAAFSRLQAAFGHAKRARPPFVLAEVARRMLERLDYISVPVASLVIVGAGYGEARAALAQRYPTAAIIEVAVSPALVAARRAAAQPRGLKKLLSAFSATPAEPLTAHIAPPNALPLADESVDLVFVNLATLVDAQLATALTEWQRVLRPGGFVLFTALGPDTGKQLVRAFAARGTQADTRALVDMHDWGDALLESGFSDPVMDMEVLTLAYATADNCLREAGQLLPTRPSSDGLRGRACLQPVRLELEAQRQGEAIALTLELIYGHAFKVQRRLAKGGTQFALADLKATLPSQQVQN